NAVLRGLERRAAKGGGLSRAATSGSVDPVADLSLPGWLWQEFRGALGARAALDAAEGMLDPEPLWLTAFAQEALDSLEADGCEVALQPGAGYPASVRVRSPMPLDRLAAYRDGLVQPQNPTSLLVARLVEAGPGTVVFDLASGRGVKSAVVAALGARVTAFELVKRRTRAAAANLARLHLDVAHVTADLVTSAPEALLRQAAAANGWEESRLAQAVLLDAPCSGTGTLRGHPEIKLRLEPADLGGLAAMQTAMLSTAAGLVAPGGSLLYAVCALTTAEGPGVIDAFLGSHPDYQPEPL